MHRYASVCLLLIAAAGCGDLTRIPTPPVPLSVLEGPQAAARSDKLTPSSTQNVRLVRAVPPQALLTLHLPDIGGSIKRFKETGLFRWLSSPEVKKQLGIKTDLWSVLQLPGPGATGNIDAARLLKALQGEFIFAVEDVRVDPKKPFPDIKLLAGITVSGAEHEAEQLLELVDMLAAQAQGVHVEKGTVGGNAFSRIVGKQPQKGSKTPQEYVLELALYQDALLAGFGRETVTAALTRLDSNEELSLADNVAFRQCMERCGDPRDAIRLHVNTATVYSRYGKYLPKEARRVLRALHFDNVRSLAAAVRFEGKNIVVSNLLDSPGGKDFLTKLLAAHPVDRHFLERIPPDANSFSIFALDGLKVIKTLRDVLPDEMLKGFEEGLAGMREDGVDLEKDVFEVFGPRCAIVNVPTGRRKSTGLDMVWDQLLGTALIFEVQDPIRGEQILTRLPAQTSYARRRQILVDGVRAYSYEFSRDGVPNDFAICYALVDNYIVVAPAERTLRRMLRSRSPMTTRRYEKVLEGVPETAVVVSFDDMREGLGLYFGAFMQGLSQSMGRPQQKESPMLRAPPNFGPSISYTVADERGVFSFTRSPMGGFGSIGGLSGLAVVAAIAVPNLHSARLRANESAAISAMRSILTAQETFRANLRRDTDGDNEGEYAFLGELLGRKRPGEKRARLRSPLISGNWVKSGGDFIRSGYRFRVYLPAEDGSPISERSKPSRIKRVDGDLAESIMVVVAWPVSKGITGNRALFLDATGRLFSCADGPYEKKKAPPPDIMSSQEGNLASRALRQGERTRDGCRWDRLR